ncbi:hypothetical protein OAF50_02420 [bacterium]|jgi:hypothetical protein|nr:hypothetical protein [bacterium]
MVRLGGSDMPKQSKQKKFLFDNEAARDTTSPFTADRNKIIDKERKKLPIGRKIKIELTNHRHPLEGELILLDDPLILSDEKANPTFEISGVEFKKNEILSWSVID